MPIQGSIVLDFGDGVTDDSFVIVELDDQVNVDSSGKVFTSIPPGVEAGFIVHYDENELRIESIICSSGSVSSGSRTTRARTQDVQFINTVDRVQLSYIQSSVPTFEWYAEGFGNSPEIEIDGRDMLALSSTPGIGVASFNIICMAYTLTPPYLELDENEVYPILCVVKMGVAL